MLAVLKHTPTEVCSKTAEHAKMLVFYLKAKAMMIMKQGKRRDEAIMIIIDGEDQSSIMLSMMLASMLRNLLLSRLRTLSICVLLHFPCSSSVFASLAIA